MRVPNISDYKNAIVIPESFATLGNLRPENGLLGDIYFSSGNFAVVFKMRDVQTGKLHAVKCFTREQERRTESLDSISLYLGTLRSPYIVPYTFLKDEIWVNDTDYPVLLMDWVDGMTLGEKVKTLCAARDTAGLHRLTVAFAEMALSLLEQDWAHGDLKHDNIMVRPDDSLALVDYDGCFVPSMSGQNAREIGSPCYRHPKRTAQHFDRHIDDFSILVIFLSLRALSQNPDLFETHQNGENLLFSVADLAEPQGSVLLGQLRRSADTYMQGTVGLLEFSVAMGSLSVFGLRDGVLRVFFEGFKEDLKPIMVILKCKQNTDRKEVVFEVDRDVNKLGLMRKRLVSIPAEIGQLTNLTILGLGENQLTSLPAEIGRLTNLTALYLKYNQITSLPTEIGRLTNLTRLNLKYNQITSLPTEIGRLTNLTELDLSGNKLSDFEKEKIKKLLPKCEIIFDNQSPDKVVLRCINKKGEDVVFEVDRDETSLELFYKNLVSLSTEIGLLTKLTMLDLMDNQLTSLPVEIGQLTNLTTLGLFRNQLTSLPVEIGQLTNLRVLDLRDNQLSNFEETKIRRLLPKCEIISVNQKMVFLTCKHKDGKEVSFAADRDATRLFISEEELINIPAEIGQLTNLATLGLGKNQLTSLPAEIVRLTNLIHLHLNNNQFASFPAEIGQLTNLIWLNLGRNQLTSFPAEIGRLINLTKLDLGYNQLISLSAEIGRLTNLAQLDLDNNQLTRFSHEIGRLTNLTRLNLSSNQLARLPTEICQLANLMKLNLKNNQLINLPYEIGRLRNLTELNLSSNQLTSIPNEISCLTNLTELNLSNNQLTSLPYGIRWLIDLRELDLQFNRFSFFEKLKIPRLLPNCNIIF